MNDMMVKGMKARLTYINQTPNYTKINPFRPNQTSGKSHQIIPDQITPKCHKKQLITKKLTNSIKSHHAKLTATQSDLNKITPIIQD